MGLLQHGMCHDKIENIFHDRIPKLTMKTKRSALIYRFKIYDVFGLYNNYTRSKLSLTIVLMGDCAQRRQNFFALTII